MDPFSKQIRLITFQKYLKDSGYELVETVHQRIYTRLTTSALKLPRGTEVFIRRLPPDLYEDELYPLFARIGLIHKLRIMLCQDQSRGFAYVTYMSIADAGQAVRFLNGFKLRSDVKISVCLSTDNRCLFVGNIPKEKTQPEIRKMLAMHMKGITEVVVHKEPQNTDLNRSYAFIEFDTHGRAELMRRTYRGKLIVWEKLLIVDWAEPRPFIYPAVMDKVTTLFMKYIPLDYTRENLFCFLTFYLLTDRILNVSKTEHFAFIEFSDKIEAQRALEKLKGLVLDGNVIQTEWARPKNFSKKKKSSISL